MVTPTLTFNGPLSGVVGSTYVYEGYLKDDLGNPLPDQPIKFYVDGQYKMNTNTDVNGHFFFSFAFRAGGARTLLVKYPGATVESNGVVVPPTDVPDGSEVWIQCAGGVEHILYNKVSGVWVRTGDDGCIPEASWGKCHPNSLVLVPSCPGGVINTQHYRCYANRWVAQQEACAQPIPIDHPDCLSGNSHWTDCGDGFLVLDKTCKSYLWKLTNAMCSQASPQITFTDTTISLDSTARVRHGRFGVLGNLSAFFYYTFAVPRVGHLVMIDKFSDSIKDYVLPSLSGIENCAGVAIASPTEVYVQYNLVLKRYTLSGTGAVESGSWNVSQSGGILNMTRLSNGSIVTAICDGTTMTVKLFLVKNDVLYGPTTAPYPTQTGIWFGRGQQVVQHPDGTIWFLYHRDGVHYYQVLHFSEITGGFQILSHKDVGNDEIYAEDPRMSAVADPATGKVLLSHVDYQYYSVGWPDGAHDNVHYMRMEEFDSSENILKTRSDSFFHNWWQSLGALVTPDGRRRMVGFMAQPDTYLKVFVSEFSSGRWCKPQYILDSVHDVGYAQDHPDSSPIVSGNNEFAVRASDGAIHYIQLG